MIYLLNVVFVVYSDLSYNMCIEVNQVVYQFEHIEYQFEHQIRINII